MPEYFCKKINMSVTPQVTVDGRIAIPDCEYYNLPDSGEFNFPCGYVPFQKCHPAGLERKAQKRSRLVSK